ncbi:unnamed protein product [Rotaria sordida]|uniref:Cation-transporting P-type ATPase N-terminal domain-containing protein n=1 Tax=Rotaria sordida TaxID=392033 RepID=A0A814V719_9BILA|nr:unnamed protein product [Rotaria sordida]
MAKKKKSTTSDNDLSSEDARREFGISIEELEKLMETRGHEGIKELNETYDGLSGLSDDEIDLSKRIAAFGRNEIPPRPFLRFIEDTFGAGIKPKKANVQLIEYIAIIVFVLVVVLITTFNDWTKERQFHSLQSIIELDQKYATKSQEFISDNANLTSNEDDSDRFKVKERSVLRTQLTKLAIQIRYAGMAIVILTVLVLLVSFSIEELIQRLSSAVTISLACAVKKMAIDNNLVRHLDPPSEKETLPEQVGNNIECSLLGFIDALGGNYPEEKFVHIYKFNSARKTMSNSYSTI